MSIKKFFALIFIISLAVFLYTKFYTQFQSITIEGKKIVKHEKMGHMNKEKPHMPSISVENNFSNNENFILLTSLITSILSFFGFIISSYHSMKGHKRDEELFSLQREKEKLEMEKLQEEIRALQRGEI
jgi:cell division protein FtsL